LNPGVFKKANMGISGLKWGYGRLESRFIILPITKNNTVRVL
jgi:hypothetical protein